MHASPRRYHVLIFLVSLSLISLEIVWTRLLSAEFFYTFAFLILSLAVLGLGLGGLTLRLVPALATERAIGPLLIITAVLALAGPLAVLHLGVDFGLVTSSLAMAGRLLLTILILCSAFFTGGIVVALILRLRHADLPKIYRSDLIGAAVGVVAAIAMMNTLGTSATVLLLPLPLLGAAVLTQPGRWLSPVGLLLAVGSLALLPWRDRLVARPREERLPVVERHWDAMALVKIQKGDGYFNLNIDNAANTPVSEFDGKWEELRKGPSPFFLDPEPLMRAQADCRFLSIGAGGGGDVLLALKNGATEVHAVEVNPFINRLLVAGGSLSAFSGRLYSDPRVHVVTEDARSYVRRHRGEFDVIYSLSSNTFAALASGAFALAENYLFTTESFRDAYRALRPGGFIIVEHQFYVPRLVTEALDGLRLCGVREPARHLAVYAMPKIRRQALLVGREPLTEAQVENAFLGLATHDAPTMHRVYPRPAPEAKPLIDRIVRAGWRQAQKDSPVDLSPATDNRPFAAQQGLLKNLTWERLKSPDAMEYRGFPVAKLLIVVVAVIVACVAVPLNLLPFRASGPGMRAVAWGYFFAIGAGFMVLELVLLQQFTLVIGPSAYTLAVLLFVLLLCSGLGSRHSLRVNDLVPFTGVVLWVLLDVLTFSAAADAMAGLPMWGRMAGCALLLAPLGYCMGMPFAKGAARVGECVDWAFAVNGAASVLGSAVVLLIAFAFGFRVALLAGAALYLVAWLLLGRRSAWQPCESAAPAAAARP
jgi:SAM-dependent methyltransferase